MQIFTNKHAIFAKIRAMCVKFIIHPIKRQSEALFSKADRGSAFERFLQFFISSKCLKQNTIQKVRF